MVPAYSHKIPRVPWYSGYSLLALDFAYGIFTLFDRLSSPFDYLCSLYVSPLPRSISLYSGLGSFPFARHYSGNHLFIFFSSGYLDVSVPRVPSLYTIYSCMSTCPAAGGFPHSDIYGSMFMCNSP